MKKLLSLATLVALAMSLNIAQAQEAPKASTKKEKAGCCSESAKASCDSKAAKSGSKASCDMSKCGDDCSSHKASSTKPKAKADQAQS